MRLNGRPVARIGSQVPAIRLYQLERKERRLRDRMQRDRIERTRLQGEITRLRCSLDDADLALYRKLVFVREGREA